MRKILLSILFFSLFATQIIAPPIEESARVVNWNSLTSTQQLETFNSGSADLSATQVASIPVDKMTESGASRYVSQLSSSQLSEVLDKALLNSDALGKLKIDQLVSNGNINKLSQQQLAQLNAVEKNKALSAIAKTKVSLTSAKDSQSKQDTSLTGKGSSSGVHVN